MCILQQCHIVIDIKLKPSDKFMLIIQVNYLHSYKFSGGYACQSSSKCTAFKNLQQTRKISKDNTITKITKFYLINSHYSMKVKHY